MSPLSFHGFAFSLLLSFIRLQALLFVPVGQRLLEGKLDFRIKSDKLDHGMKFGFKAGGTQQAIFLERRFPLGALARPLDGIDHGVPFRSVKVLNGRFGFKSINCDEIVFDREVGRDCEPLPSSD